MSILCIVCHYGEIGIKGKNRGFFERALQKNIVQALKKHQIPFEKATIINERIVLLLDESYFEKTGEILKNIPGMSFFCFALKCETKLENINECALNLLQKEKGNTFRISTQRANKQFALTSLQINVCVGSFIVEKLNKKVKLKGADVECFIEIVNKFSYIYTKKQRGIGGLPVGVSGTVVSLMSGGIDSPVASFLMMKRGAKVIFVHFHAFPYTSRASIEKVKKIVNALNKFQLKSKIYFVPFSEIQKHIFEKTQGLAEKQRIIIYRRFMLKITEKISKKENSKAIVTGDSLGQVASQTSDNMFVISKATKYPIFRPLIGFDKEEIIVLSKKIDVFNLSILPCQDVCSRFLPKNPTTKSNLEAVKRIENQLPSVKLINGALKNADVLEI
ncbi:MAG: tRNA 4-thiouridine(8) synthase ThiI [Candidatus Huberarchaeum crystalense]|uniref:Probable tRNA sulfurtransferase n=1 Tax=Huberarchaeum crystalense TaxID=2014257 RepID=A0A2G9LJL9_HUBC1|nr:MAG: tRNA 4-thiouridine(8) synthase ThiI [Candidatus Huberarchaeum crystalense]PIV13487.1 MAG: tRNA 4-thiouridine(8) synthase ThiI [Candidatus Huberarchaeum crystalense]PIV89523.1 MAG: tRNA 4-thiouridine(8) synthase ThiI [Candidatus Huberarchaeum crystalense]PIX27973.1 MAG: tRNA 4-thiouridine(8) synthase ThiI [Candidatus Huberarchaeum crystalense]PIY99619.1 MAG: tRNA 4-thiouridine(8) synthase ThiI [Candidatus Huberarchaeum crystalense]